jgi:hypothetical protein
LHYGIKMNNQSFRKEEVEGGVRNSPTNVLFSIVQKADDYRLKKWMKGE